MKTQVCMLLVAAVTCVSAQAADAAAQPAQVEGLKALHRAGQTFLTWNDPEDAFGEKPVTWGQLRDAKTRLRYRVYRAERPITAESVKQAKPLAEVAPLSGFNANSWSLERLINQTVFANDDRGELMKYGPFKGWSMDSPEGGKLIIPRLAIEDGKPLPPGTGLYVHSAAAKANAYYAVTAVADGVESAPAVLAQPVAEEPGAWEPVEQPSGSGFGFDFRGTRHFYVTWVAPPLAPQPMYFNWSVLVPPSPSPSQGEGRERVGLPSPGSNPPPAPSLEGRGVTAEPLRPVELYFHAPGYSYARPPVKFLERSIQICPHDFPFSGWYGFRDPEKEGLVRPYTVRRIEAFLKWAQSKFPLDPHRIIPVGGDGAALMALYRPELFAYVLITGFEARQLDPKSADAFTAAWGPRSPDVKDEQGRGEWAWGEPDVLLCGRPMPSVMAKTDPPPPPEPEAPGCKLELPLFVCRSYSWGRNPDYGKGRGRFYYALQSTRHALHAHWAWGGNLTAPEKFSGLWQGLDLTNSTPIPAITYSSEDKEGEGGGQQNHSYTWSDVKEDADSFEVAMQGQPSTFDLTPRRLLKLRPKPGEKFRFETTSQEVPHWARRKKPEPKSGVIAADANGLITLKGLEVATGYKLIVRIAREKQ